MVVSSTILVLGVEFSLVASEAHRYLRLRWKAWTGIPPSLVPFIGPCNPKVTFYKGCFKPSGGAMELVVSITL
ncbi:hypothetical protein B0O99DRAFT_634187 [Bisporella sp. PMI_857]|nr:hypothetical protein B0O99DRAFT_634187 [Bisporella sp. PMI_857]